MLVAYIDDSGMGQAPVSVLAGWIASASTWARFSDEWQKALEMKPRLWESPEVKVLRATRHNRTIHLTALQSMI